MADRRLTSRWRWAAVGALGVAVVAWCSADVVPDDVAAMYMLRRCRMQVEAQACEGRPVVEDVGECGGGWPTGATVAAVGVQYRVTVRWFDWRGFRSESRVEIVDPASSCPPSAVGSSDLDE